MKKPTAEQSKKSKDQNKKQYSGKPKMELVFPKLPINDKVTTV